MHEKCCLIDTVVRMDNFFVGCIGGERRGGGSELGALGCGVHLLHVTFTPPSLCIDLLEFFNKPDIFPL